MLSNFARILTGLQALGLRRVIALALAGLLTTGAVMLASYLLSRPSAEALYTGLTMQDVTRIGAALQEAGIAFDANAENTAVYVPVGQAARARMLLAERGLPQSDRAGYELFDNMGSLGLTSFMQQVTRVRALEGELARSIQLINGVKAARVHIVIPKDGSFRNDKSVPTASIVIRTDAGFSGVSTKAIKHLVAAAVPSLTSGDVTVLSTDGTLLSAGEGQESAAPEKMVELERDVGKEIQDKISRTLAPFLGVDNYRVSVAVKLNADRSEVSETKFDPESRVERSVRTIKETGEAENSQSDQPVSAAENIPQEAAPSGGGADKSSEKKDRREELTNYEINSKSVSTVSDGYRVENLSVAILVNKAQLTQALGANPAATAAADMLAEIKALATSAAGINAARGDLVTVSSADFLALDAGPEEAAGEGAVEILLKHLGSMINAGTLLVVVLMVLLMGLRPAVRMIAGGPNFEAQLAAPSANPRLAAPEALGAKALPGAERPGGIGSLADELLDIPQTRKLAEIVALDSERAARIIRAWLNEPERA